MAEPLRLLMLCMGNICRSPMAEGALRARLLQAGMAGEVQVDSAGTGGWHAGDAADPRSRASALARGYDLSAHRARQVVGDDFARFDRLLVMDRMNLRDLTNMAPGEGHDRIAMFLHWSGVAADYVDLPDPYYGQARDFERVIDLAESGVDGLIAKFAR